MQIGRTTVPPALNKSERERVIYDAAMRLMSEKGPGALTLRKLADELGGSITLVTHVYPDRAALMKGLTRTAIAEFDADLATLEDGADDRERLRLLLEWMLPLSAEEQRKERARVMLVSYRDSDLHVGVFSTAMDRKMRALLRSHLAPFRRGDELDAAVELLRVLINGVVLAAAEHPGKWPRRRIIALLDNQLRLMDLA